MVNQHSTLSELCLQIETLRQIWHYNLVTFTSNPMEKQPYFSAAVMYDCMLWTDFYFLWSFLNSSYFSWDTSCCPIDFLTYPRKETHVGLFCNNSYLEKRKKNCQDMTCDYFPFHVLYSESDSKRFQTPLEKRYLALL